jgi:5-methylthioribose kinase
MIIEIWTKFSKKFEKKLKEEMVNGLYNENIIKKESKLKEKFIKKFMFDLLNDSLSFSCFEMIRRVIGVASCLDMLNVKDEKVRAGYEILLLNFSKKILFSKFDSIEKIFE